MLRYTGRFIPSPVGSCCHNSIIKGLDDFLRKYQWRFVNFSSNVSHRFLYRSNRYPPKELIPDSVLHSCFNIRRHVLFLLRSCCDCFTRDNLTTEERSELLRLKGDTSIVVSTMDKGSGWTILPNTQYESEAYRQLCDETFYLPIDRDIDPHVYKRLVILLSSLYSRKFLSRREALALEPNKPGKPRRFYLLPKVHKSSWLFSCMPPGRPIVSDTSSVSRTCATLLEYFLGPLAHLGKSYVRDSLQVICFLQNLVLYDNSLLCTMDIASLYTNIPTEEGIAAVSRMFSKHPDPKRPDLTLLTMLRIILTNNNFCFRGDAFLQVQGTAMGCAFGPSYATIFLNDWEEKVYSYHVQPFCWLRFIDDIFFIWNGDESSLFTFNSFVDSIIPSITVDLSFSFYEIRFLDLCLYRSGNRVLYRVGFKPTDTHAILSPVSYHPRSVFRSILFGQLYRWSSRSSTYTDFLRTKRIVQPCWLRQGYTRSAVRRAVRRLFALTGQTPDLWATGFYPCSCVICTFSSPTTFVTDPVSNNPFLIVHRLSCESHNVVYFISCKKCKAGYVGQTSRKLSKRISEHVYHISSCSNTPVAKHFTSNCNLSDFWFTGLEHCPTESKRLLVENKWMKRLHTLTPSGLNQELNRTDRLHLVLPYSDCSQRVVQLCRRQMDVNFCPSFSMHPNLERLLSTNR